MPGNLSSKASAQQTSPKARELIRQYQAFISSPPLLSHHPEFKVFKLEEKATQPEELKIPDKLVFGKRMEKFFSLYIKNSQRFEMLAENLQIIDGKTTLGELDFIVYDRDKDEILHIELACKFYLYLPTPGSPERQNWVGPNRNDRLDKKLQKLSKRQFPMIHHPETRKMLQSLGTHYRDIGQQLCLQGMLFLPYQSKFIPAPPVNPHSIMGEWLHASQFKDGFQAESGFYFPGKEDWLLPQNQAPDWMDFTSAQKVLDIKMSERQSVMCWVRLRDNSHKRIFVVWW